MTKEKIYFKEYRIVVCPHCGCKNKFPHYLDENGLDLLCDECGLYLDEYA